MAVTKPAEKLPSLSVFFPCFNEEKNVPVMIKKTAEFLPKIADKYEIIIVDDGSTDNTAQTALELKKIYPEVKLVSHDVNLGYGAGLQTGFKTAQYDWIFYTDGDAQFDITELKRFVPHAQQHQVILGYRQNRADGWSRAVNARLFKWYIDVLFRLGVKDIDCAFKLMRTDLIQSLELFSDGAFICSEYLYKLKKQGIKFKQLPVKHFPRQHGQPTGARPDVIVQALVDAMRLYLKMKFGLNL